MGIQKVNKQAVVQLMAYILEKRITKIHTQRALHRMIEIAKWPYTTSLKHHVVRHTCGRQYSVARQRLDGEPLYWQGPVYSAGQYIRVREFLIDKFLDEKYVNGKYQYIVNHEKIRANLQELVATLAQ